MNTWGWGEQEFLLKSKMPINVCRWKGGNGKPPSGHHHNYCRYESPMEAKTSAIKDDEKQHRFFGYLHPKY